MQPTLKLATEFYADTLADAAREGSAREAMNHLGRRDVYYLLAYLCNRRDMMDEWLYERCVEVQKDPNDHLDLWAREHYKSTIITFGKTMQDILDSHSPDSFYWDQELTVGIFSHTKGIARAFQAQIMQEFETNQDLKDIYPEVLFQDPKRESERWSLDRGFVVKRKANPKEGTCESWGLVDGQPTSKHYLLRVYDDVVTIESVATTEQIQKTTSAWEISLNLGVKEIGIERYIGTRYNYNDTYKDIMDRGVHARIHTANKTGEYKHGETGVFMSSKELDKRYKRMGIYTYGCQMNQDPRADASQNFLEEWLRYWMKPVWEGMIFYILVDPAHERKKDSSFSAFLVVGLGRDQNYYVVDGVRDRLSLTQRADTLFRLHRDWRPLGVGYEKYGLQADIQHMENKMSLENYHFDITQLGGGMPKDDRIKGMVPHFQFGRVFIPIQHNFVDVEGRTQDLTRLIKDEYKAFPASIFKDLLDCLARILDPDLGAVFPKGPTKVRAGQVEKVKTNLKKRRGRR